ncbi:hypothetical protein GCM10020358_32160 [Amorphoplanes nipponensis]|uniref:NB-ARC domain-containing protein n=1 Tax=Actinoplanes nipponensis TaxID=135950 RepID=A0A919MIZ0_9ACTN|nr:tetratricopeptide repeat protein [Actinoplanes nipponensis]GIE51259.1 hypothetical protein Ani05nite_47930 [Actinoplanes nipponensis]
MGHADDPAAGLRARLHALYRLVRKPAYRELRRKAALAGATLPPATLGALLNGRGVPRWETVAAFVTACRRCAEDHRPHLPLPPEMVDLELWWSLHEQVTTARRQRADAARDGSRRAAVAVPALLPADVRGFAGRDAQLAALDHLLATAGEEPTAVVISAVSGTAGVGKTALAVHWAHRVRRRFPDGQLYVNLRGFHPTGAVMDPAEAIRGFLDALSVAPQRIPAGLDAQAALYRTVLADKRILILLDNARDAEQARPLLPATGGCLAVLTSRHQLTGLVAAVGAYPLTLDLLTDDEARQLLTRRLGPDRIAAQSAAVDEIITACARLPLALAIVAARAAAQPHLPLTALAEQLRSSQGRLDLLSTGDPGTDVRAVFSWSCQRLSAAAAGLFRLLGLHPGPDISLPAAASLVGLSPARARPLLTELVRAQLITEPAAGRYALHDLLRAYAVEQGHIHDPEPDRRAGTHRLLDHYLHTAYAADRLLNPQRDPIALTAPRPGVTPEPVTDHGRALAWLTTEHRVLLAALHHAAVAGFDTHTWQLAWTLVTFLDRRGHWHDALATKEAALAAALRSADLPAQARAHRLLGQTYTRLGRYDDAHSHLRQALTRYGRLADRTGEARTHLDLGLMFGRQDDYGRARTHAQQAEILFRAVGHRVGQANAHNAVGWYHARLGDHEQALTYCCQALAWQQDLGNRHGEASTWDSLGYVHHHLGHHDRAVACYQRAVDLFRELGNRHHEATTLTRLGDLQHAAGNTTDARAAWQHALDILTDLHHPDAGPLRVRLHPPAGTA